MAILRQFDSDLKSLVSLNLTFPSDAMVATLNRVALVDKGVELLGPSASPPAGLLTAKVIASCTAPAGVSAISFTSLFVSTSFRRDARDCSKIVTGP